MPDGGIAHVRFAAARRTRCAFCGWNFASVECDFEIEPGITCDAKMCASCSRPVGEDLDYCPDHAQFAARAPMRMPNTRKGLIEAGYMWIDAGQCRGCLKRIEWWLTPKSRKIPMTVNPDDTLTCHFGVCPDRLQFRSANRRHAERAHGKKPIQQDLLSLFDDGIRAGKSIKPKEAK